MTESEAIEELKNSIISYEVKNPSNITCDLTTEVLDMAIKSLEKQIPKKPKCIDKETETFDCPCCGHTIIALDDMTIHNNCLMCGQRLDWSDE